MKPLVKQLKPLVWLVGIGASVTIFAFSTFATIKYVDDKIASVKEDVHDTKVMVMDIYRDQLGKEPRLNKD